MRIKRKSSHRGHRGRAQRTLRRETQEHSQESSRKRRGMERRWLCHGWDFGFGNKEEDGLVRGAGFVMIWMFLVSRGNSAADCL